MQSFAAMESSQDFVYLVKTLHVADTTSDELSVILNAVRTRHPVVYADGVRLSKGSDF